MTTEQKSLKEGNLRDLVNRLRGIYVIKINDGAGPLDGQATVTRTFDKLPPIMGEAAAAIEALMETPAHGSLCFAGPDIVGQQVYGEWRWFKRTLDPHGFGTVIGWMPTELPEAPK